MNSIYLLYRIFNSTTLLAATEYSILNTKVIVVSVYRKMLLLVKEVTIIEPSVLAEYWTPEVVVSMATMADLSSMYSEVASSKEAVSRFEIG